MAFALLHRRRSPSWSRFLWAAAIGCSVGIGSASAAEPQALCHARGIGYRFSVPKGWVLDNATGARTGVCAVAYPEGERWSDSPSVLYANVVAKEGGQSLTSVIAGDVSRFKKETPGIAVGRPSPWRLDDRHSAERRTFVSSTAWEDVAYVDAPNGVALFVLSARTKDAWQSSQGAFESFVRTYQEVSAEETRRTIVSLAEADLNRPGGKAYEGEFSRYFGAHLLKAVAGCSAASPKDMGPANFVAEVQADGRLSDVSMLTSSAVNRGLRPQLLNETFPKPPFAPMHVLVELRITP